MIGTLLVNPYLFPRHIISITPEQIEELKYDRCNVVCSALQSLP